MRKKDLAHLEVFNESRDGRTTRYDSGEHNGLGVIGDKLTFRAPLDYVIIMLGTNDVKSQYGPPTAGDIAVGMGLILDFIDAHSDGAEPILLTPPPLGEVTSGDLAGARSRISPVAAEYRLLAMNRNIRLIDIHAVLNDRSHLEADGIHLNVAGRQQVADAIWAHLQNVSVPPPVMGFSGTPIGDHFKLAWNAAGADTFYYRVRRNGNVIGRTLNTSLEITAPVVGDIFTVEAVDYAQNTGPASGIIINSLTGPNYAIHQSF